SLRELAIAAVGIVFFLFVVVVRAAILAAVAVVVLVFFVAAARPIRYIAAKPAAARSSRRRLQIRFRWHRFVRRINALGRRFLVRIFLRDGLSFLRWLFLLRLPLAKRDQPLGIQHYMPCINRNRKHQRRLPGQPAGNRDQTAMLSNRQPTEVDRQGREPKR